MRHREIEKRIYATKMLRKYQNLENGQCWEYWGIENFGKTMGTGKTGTGITWNIGKIGNIWNKK